MQDRRHRPGDVLDDYCPRERRITDHAIVAMIEDEIRRTRCASCDAEHEYKEAKVPSPRRKTPPPALFNQVLEGINGPTAPHPVEVEEAELPAVAAAAAVALAPAAVVVKAPAAVVVKADAPPASAPEPVALRLDDATPIEVSPEAEDDSREEGGFRRSLIRATFPRPEGAAPPPRSAPEFTIQSLNNRRNNNQRTYRAEMAQRHTLSSPITGRNGISPDRFCHL